MARLARKHLDFTDWITEAAEAVYMVIIINGYVALSQLNSGFVYIVAVNIGACIGWGFIDGFTYAVGGSIDRGKEVALIKKIQTEKDPERAVSEVVDELDDTFVSRFSPQGKQSIAKEILRNAKGVSYVKQRFITKEELQGFGSILLVYLTAGVALSLPYLVLHNKIDAWLISNLLGISWLFFYGFRVGQILEGKKIFLGLITAGAGIAFLLVSYFVYT